MNRKFIYEDYLKVIEYFNTNLENETKDIAKYFNLHLALTSFYIDVYLSHKRNYMGGKVFYPTSPMVYRKTNNNGTTKKYNKVGSKYEISVYEGDDLLGTFHTLQSACDFLGLRNSQVVSRNIKMYGNEATVYSRKLKKRLTYIKKEL